VMDKIDKPRGLIRYSSENAIREEEQKLFTPRVAGFTGILVVLTVIFVSLLSMRPDTETTILREPGTLYQSLPNNIYSNIYNLTILNKSFEDLQISLELESPKGEILSLGSIDVVPSQNSAEGRFLVKLPEDQLDGLRTELIFGVYANGEKIENITSGFLGPANLK